jgi:hypothetical protein
MLPDASTAYTSASPFRMRWAGIAPAWPLPLPIGFDSGIASSDSVIFTLSPLENGPNTAPLTESTT